MILKGFCFNNEASSPTVMGSETRRSPLIGGSWFAGVEAAFRKIVGFGYA